MNSPSHILIGTIVYEYLYEKYSIPLEKSSFLKGNTRPDHSLSFIRPHRMKYCRKMVQRKTARLCKKDAISPRASKKFGVLCHYYADFFCCAHNPQFSGNIKEHILHEDKLLIFLRNNYEVLRSIDYLTNEAFPDSVSEINHKMQNLFRKRPTCENDFEAELVSAIQACASLVLSICLNILSAEKIRKLPAAS